MFTSRCCCLFCEYWSIGALAPITDVVLHTSDKILVELKWYNEEPSCGIFFKICGDIGPLVILVCGCKVAVLFKTKLKNNIKVCWLMINISPKFFKSNYNAYLEIAQILEERSVIQLNNLILEQNKPLTHTKTLKKWIWFQLIFIFKLHYISTSSSKANWLNLC